MGAGPHRTLVFGGVRKERNTRGRMVARTLGHRGRDEPWGSWQGGTGTKKTLELDGFWGLSQEEPCTWRGRPCQREHWPHVPMWGLCPWLFTWPVLFGPHSRTLMSSANWSPRGDGIYPRSHLWRTCWGWSPASPDLLTSPPLNYTPAEDHSSQRPQLYKEEMI